MCQSVDLWSARAWIMGDPGTFNGGRHSGATPALQYKNYIKTTKCSTFNILCKKYKNVLYLVMK